MGSALDARAAYQVTRTCHRRPAIETFGAITVKSRHNRQIAQARTFTQTKNQLHNSAVTYRATHRRRYRYSAPICHRTRVRFVRRTSDEHSTSIATGCLWWWCRVVCQATHVNHPDMVCLHTNSVGRSSWSSVRPCCRHAVLDNVGAHTYTNYWAKGLVGWRCCPSSSS